MTPGQVQFCYAIVQGNAERANEFLPPQQQEQRDFLFESDDYGYNPSIICLWAYEQKDPHAPIKKLQQLFPIEMSASPEQPSSPRALVSEIVFPIIKNSVKAFYIPIGQHYNKIDQMNEENAASFITFANEALRVVLKDESFNGIEVDDKQRIERTYEKLRELRVEGKPTKEGKPNSIRHLMANLHQYLGDLSLDDDVEDPAAENGDYLTFSPGSALIARSRNRDPAAPHFTQTCREVPEYEIRSKKLRCH